MRIALVRRAGEQGNGVACGLGRGFGVAGGFGRAASEVAGVTSKYGPTRRGSCRRQDRHRLVGGGFPCQAAFRPARPAEVCGGLRRSAEVCGSSEVKGKE
jgi:hypothetical protein